MTHLDDLYQRLHEQTERWQEQEFNQGKIDGQCGYDNANFGAICPSPYYHAGYVVGIHERLLADNNVREKDWHKWELIADVRDARFPLSSPIEFRLVLKNAGELNAEEN